MSGSETSGVSASFTPGEWRVYGCELIGDSTLIATLHWHTGRDRENAADAHLLAAAKKMYAALETAEAALADIGDADREDGDDVAWCEQRAAKALPIVRAALAAARGEGQ